MTATNLKSCLLRARHFPEPNTHQRLRGCHESLAGLPTVSWALMRLAQACGRQRDWLSAGRPGVPGPLREFPCPQSRDHYKRLEEWTAEKFCSEGTGGHSPGLIYFDLLAPTFSCLFCPFKIIECEGWLNLTTSVFWSWVRTPYQIVPCGPPAYGLGKNKGNCHPTLKSAFYSIT